MPKYRVEATFDMGMSRGNGTHTFTAEDDAAAKAYINEHQGGSLSPIKRDVRFDISTLSRDVE